jgi:nucleoside-diphosphate-sugar epimerase
LRIFLTGGSGYIGRAFAARLVADGHEVRALVRSASRREPLERLGAALFTGDVIDRASMREAMSGADVVVHAAADLDLSGPAGRMQAVNVGGSENVASLASKLGVPRFLSVSSVAYFGGSPADGSPGREDDSPRRPFPTEYSRTKHEGQRAILAWAERGLKVVTVYPSLVYGPPGKKEGSNAMLRQLLLRRFPMLVGADRITSWIFLDDLVDGMARALERAAPGSAYLMAGEATRIDELVRRVGELSGVKMPRREISLGTARFFLRLALPWFRVVGRRPPMALTQLSSLERHWHFDDARARHDLGWSRRGLDQGLPATLDFLRRELRLPH